jgi:hypothetical protein
MMPSPTNATRSNVIEGGSNAIEGGSNAGQLTVARVELELVALYPALSPGKGTKTIMELEKTVA